MLHALATAKQSLQLCAHILQLQVDNSRTNPCVTSSGTQPSKFCTASSSYLGCCLESMIPATRRPALLRIQRKLSKHGYAQKKLHSKEVVLYQTKCLCTRIPGLAAAMLEAPFQPHLYVQCFCTFNVNLRKPRALPGRSKAGDSERM